MKSSFYRQTVKWSASLLSCATMIFSPVAMGKEAERNSQAYIVSAVKEFGLDKQTTLGQFWDNSKAYVPGYMYQELKDYVAQNKNTLMPEVTIGSAKSSTGEMIPVLKVTKNGKTDTVQIFGEKNKWAKINGVTFTEDDFKNPETAIFKYSRSDIKLRKDLEKFENEQGAKSAPKTSAAVEGYKKDFARFKGFPRITPQMWTSLTPKQRAGYIVKMRLLWNDARVVLQNAREQGASTQQNKKSAAIETFLRVIMGQDASAQTSPIIDVSPNKAGSLDGAAGPAPKPKRGIARVDGRTSTDTTTGKPVVVGSGAVSSVVSSQDSSSGSSIVGGSSTVVSSDSGTAVGSAAPGVSGAPRGDKVRANVGFSGQCIVAGYVANYAAGENNKGPNRTVCNAAAKADGYSQIDYVTAANEKCVQLKGSATLKAPAIKGKPQYRWIACNPITYSYSDNGDPICIDRKSDIYQQATHFDPKPDTDMGCDEASRLSEGNTPPFDPKVVTDRNEQIKLIEKSQKEQDYKLTEKFLTNMLKAKDPALERLFSGRASLSNDWTADMQKLDEELLQIQKNFETEITQAIAICKADKGSYSTNQERNQPGACDQLQRRWLFTEKFIAEIRQKGCLDGSSYVGSYKKEDFITGNGVTVYNKEQTYKTKTVSATPGSSVGVADSTASTVKEKVLLCECADSAKTKVGLGEKCPSAPPPLSQPPSEQPAEQCKLTGDHVVGAPAADCACEKGYKVDKKTNTCKKKSNKAWLLAIPVLGILAFLVFKGKKKKDPPNTCNLPKKLVAGVCMCQPTVSCPADLMNEETCDCKVEPPPPPPVCPTEACSDPNQTRTPAPDCQCTNVPMCPAPNQTIPVSQGCPAVEYCPDGSVKPADGVCKKSCPDGSSVPVGQSCPVPPSEGGDGDNDGDFGGV